MDLVVKSEVAEGRHATGRLSLPDGLGQHPRGSYRLLRVRPLSFRCRANPNTYALKHKPLAHGLGQHPRWGHRLFHRSLFS